MGLNPSTGRSNRRGPRDRNAIAQLPWSQLTNRLAPVEVLSADEVEHIHATSLRLLAEVGMSMHDPQAREILARAGCDVDHGTMRVRFDPAFVEQQVAKAPSSFTLRARNPARELTLGGNHINFTSVVGPAYCSDLDRGRRPGMTQDVREYVRLLQSLNMAAFASGQLARRHKLPWRSSNACAANLVDAQAAYESEMSIWSTVMSHCNLVIHGTGWLEGGLTASFEKLIVDAEMLQMMSYMLRPIDVGSEAMGLDAFKEVGPGGHFFGAADTLKRYETALYTPLVSDLRTFENWRDGGALTTEQRANRVWRQLLATHLQPEIDAGLLGELRAFVDRRKEEVAAGVRAA